MKKKVLVTGGTGFLGSHICKRLIHQDINLICIDNLSSSDESNIESLKVNNNFTFIKHDVIDPIDDKFDEIYGEENGKLALGLQQFEMREGKSENFSAGMNEGHDWSTLYLRGVNDEPVVPMELITYLSLNHELKDEK